MTSKGSPSGRSPSQPNLQRLPSNLSDADRATMDEVRRAAISSFRRNQNTERFFEYDGKRYTLQYERGHLVKVNGMRPEYMSGHDMISLIRALGAEILQETTR